MVPDRFQHYGFRCDRRWLLALVSSFTLGLPLPTGAQIVPDNTLPVNSRVTVGCTNCTITGGTVRGANLFHSFSQFSIPSGGVATFNHGLEIQNIITRVTGNTPSTIDGRIQTNGTTNLFLINPNGIQFGANANLSVGGAFVVSTANSIRFKDGSEFSAVAPQPNALLTVSVPLGLQFGAHPAPVTLPGIALERRQGAADLPATIAELPIIAITCERIRRSDFVITGRGGVPQDASQLLRGETVWQDVRLANRPPLAVIAPDQRAVISDVPFNAVNAPPTPDILEAQAWVVDAQGGVTLVAQTGGRSPWLPEAGSCRHSNALGQT